MKRGRNRRWTESERERRKKKRKPVTGYTETMAFNNRSYKRFWWSTAAERAKRSGPTSAAGNRYPPCNYRLSLRLVSLSFCVCIWLLCQLIYIVVCGGGGGSPSGRKLSIVSQQSFRPKTTMTAESFGGTIRLKRCGGKWLQYIIIAVVVCPRNREIVVKRDRNSLVKNHQPLASSSPPPSSIQHSHRLLYRICNYCRRRRRPWFINVAHK